MVLQLSDDASTLSAAGIFHVEFCSPKYLFTALCNSCKIEECGSNIVSFGLKITFLPRDAMLSMVYAVVVCLCVSVRHTPVLYQNG